MTQKRMPSPYPRRDETEGSYEHAKRAYDQAWAEYERLNNAEEFQYAGKALDEAIAAFNAAWARYHTLWLPVEAAGVKVDRTYAALSEAIQVRQTLVSVT